MLALLLKLNIFMYLFLSLVNAFHWCSSLYLLYLFSLFLTILLWPSSLVLYHHHAGLALFFSFLGGISLSSVLVISSLKACQCLLVNYALVFSHC